MRKADRWHQQEVNIAAMCGQENQRYITHNGLPLSAKHTGNGTYSIIKESWTCSAQSAGLHNLQIALCSLLIASLRGQTAQSGDSCSYMLQLSESCFFRAGNLCVPVDLFLLSTLNLIFDPSISLSAKPFIDDAPAFSVSITQYGIWKLLPLWSNTLQNTRRVSHKEIA